jgi:hypothetical protein
MKTKLTLILSIFLTFLVSAQEAQNNTGEVVSRETIYVTVGLIVGLLLFMGIMVWFMEKLIGKD